ncbi:GIY-YIG nuclease family protein [Arthrobacter dokdonensis]|uniref:GIY-YIG nuclease family protein n=1 Tax=Arthrobacter dokdonellae TaxID=2211210 RepID=UPI001013D1C8|nr:GIY-YIG nuclease family protein [Arthrobacter dokdonellae]
MEHQNATIPPLGFRNWPTSGVQSLAYRFAPEESRTGIYVLTFSDGYRYVGQSLNVVNRFASHRRRWDDITHIAFRAFMPDELNAREREALAAIERQGHNVRNLDLAGHPGGDSLLDVVMEEEAQAEWLDSLTPEPTDAPRYLGATRRMTGLQKFHELMARPDAEGLVTAAATYIGLAIPWPSQTEGRFWTATAISTSGRRPNWRRLITISAQNAEVSVIGETTTDSGCEVAGFLNIDKGATGIDRWLQRHGIDAVVDHRPHKRLMCSSRVLAFV